jgi:hypothetical protein
MTVSPNCLYRPPESQFRVTVALFSLAHHTDVLGEKASLHHRHWHGGLGKVHFRTQVKRIFAFPGISRPSLCPQSRPGRGEPSLRGQHRHSRHHRLPRGHEAVRSRSSTLLSSPPCDPTLRPSPQRYNLGPNGAILTALNLFTTKFDQVLDLVEKRAETVECASVSFSETILSHGAPSAM